MFFFINFLLIHTNYGSYKFIYCRQKCLIFGVSFERMLIVSDEKIENDKQQDDANLIITDEDSLGTGNEDENEDDEDVDNDNVNEWLNECVMEF